MAQELDCQPCLLMLHCKQIIYLKRIILVNVQDVLMHAQRVLLLATFGVMGWQGNH